MIATFTIESLLFIYTVARYRMTPLGRIIGASLACLAIFQFAEYHVCGLSTMPASWSRVGYVAITLLPALGIHLVQEIAGKSSRLLQGAAYASSLTFAGVFGLNGTIFQGHVCGGNYAIFQMASPMGGIYFTYYYFWLFVGMALAWYYALSASRNIRKALLLQMFGYVSFVLPTSIVNAVSPQTLSGVPSIMCGFAVTYALILVFMIVPLVLSRRSTLTRRAASHSR